VPKSRKCSYKGLNGRVGLGMVGGASCKVETWWMKVGKEGFFSQQDYSQEGAAPSSDLIQP
jgi:hypothetical protein